LRIISRGWVGEMKKILAVVLSALCLVALVSCSAKKTTTNSNLVGISVVQAPTGWVAGIQYYAQLEAKKDKLNYKLEVAQDPNQQASQVDTLINMKSKIIVLWPDNDTLEVSAQKIMDAGIICYDFDRSVDPVTPTYYLAGDNYGMGVAGADYIAQKLNNTGDVIIASVSSYGDAVNGQRVKGFTDEIKKVAPNIKILGTYDSSNASATVGYQTMTDALQANPHIDGVYSIDDELSEGLYKAVTQQKRTDVKVMTGGGGAQAYFQMMPTAPDGVWLASSLYSPAMMSTVIDNVQKILKGETVEKKIIIPSKIVDRTTYKSYLDTKSPY
jgi:ribose transport system substrate-binding protein